VPRIPEERFDIDAIKERLRADVCRKESLLGNGVATNSVPRAALKQEKPYSEALQFNLTGKVEPQIAKLPALIEQAREKTEVSRWVPKVFRRLFRRQGGFNKILLDSLKALVKTQRGLSAENRELREYLQAQFYWLRDQARNRTDDRAWISALNARSVTQEQTSHQIQAQFDRQGDRVSELLNFISAIVANVDVQSRRADDLERQVQVVAAHAVEFEKRVELETRSRSTVIAELEEEEQARSSRDAELLARLDNNERMHEAASQAFREAQTEFAQELDQLKTTLVHELAVKRDVQGQLETLKSALDTLRGYSSQVEERQLSDSAYIKSQLSIQQQLVHDRLHSKGQSVAKTRAATGSLQNAESDHRHDAFYLAFENRFRGQRSEIKNRLQAYLPRVGDLKVSKKTMRIVDLGCGRGEWLELLKENGYNQIRGVDANIAMAAYCRERDLAIVVEDCVDYLAGLKESSLHVISGFHVIEHLPFGRLMRLLAECHRVLKPGGLLILETPNPDNLIVAAKNFYTDPTHQRPLPSLLMSFLAEHVGFSKVEIVNQHPFNPDVLVHEEGEVASRFNQLFYGAQDYAVIARKSSPEALR
jgi:O-antigen chain-terminating methyltransferase